MYVHVCIPINNDHVLTCSQPPPWHWRLQHDPASQHQHLLEKKTQTPGVRHGNMMIHGSNEWCSSIPDDTQEEATSTFPWIQRESRLHQQVIELFLARKTNFTWGVCQQGIRIDLQAKLGGMNAQHWEKQHPIWTHDWYWEHPCGKWLIILLPIFHL